MRAGISGSGRGERQAKQGSGRRGMGNGEGGSTGRFAIVADAPGIGARFRTITHEMAHLETIPAFHVFGIAWFLLSILYCKSSDDDPH